MKNLFKSKLKLTKLGSPLFAYSIRFLVTLYLFIASGWWFSLFVSNPAYNVVASDNGSDNKSLNTLEKEYLSNYLVLAPPFIPNILPNEAISLALLNAVTNDE